MGLDIYVGSLTRYFARDWKTVVQQAAERGEIPPVQVVRTNEPEDVVTDPEQIRHVVVDWQQGLSDGLGNNLSSPLSWDETNPTPWFTDKPAWDCYGALLLWAAYSEHPDLKRPAANPCGLPGGGDWSGDPAYQRSVAKDSRTRYAHLLRNVEIWLPGEFTFTFGATWVTGVARQFGACSALVAQLDDLNARTWRATQAQLVEWRRDGADFGAPLEVAARFGFALMRDLAGRAAEHRLPMLLDY